MNSVYVPAQVAILLRGIVNVVSTLSISHQYILLRRRATEEDVSGPVEQVKKQKTMASESVKSWKTLRDLQEVEWPSWTNRTSWDWPAFVKVGGSGVLAMNSAAPTNSRMILKCTHLFELFSCGVVEHGYIFSFHSRK